MANNSFPMEAIVKQSDEASQQYIESLINSQKVIDEFNDKYLGEHSIEPTHTTSGGDLFTGSLYFDKDLSRMRVFDGSIWTSILSGSTGPTGPTGPVGPSGRSIGVRGEHAAINTYNTLDLVTAGGSAYIALKSTLVGTAITDTEYWVQIAAKGDTGPAGPAGPAEFSSFNEIISTVSEPVTFQPKLNLLFDGNNVTKTGNSDVWGVGQVADQVLRGDGRVSTTVAEIDTQRIFGLNIIDSSQSWDELDYAILLHPDIDKIDVRENGHWKGYFGAYQTGDVLSIERAGSTITYLKNNEVVYTSTVAVTASDLLVDFSIRSPGGTLKNIVIETKKTLLEVIEEQETTIQEMQATIQTIQDAV